MSEWTARSVDLFPWRGQSLRLAFVVENALGFLNVHLDDIRLPAASVAPTIFDVYFGTNEVPATTEFLGSTTNHFWTLPMLEGGVDYYWQIRARRDTTVVAGPFWLFTTAGNHGTARIFDFGERWRYWAAGSLPGKGWFGTSFDYSDWPLGVAPLGFGGLENTTIGYRTNGYTTFYFRTTFTVSDTNRLVSVVSRLKRDDGAVVYVNGVEAFRENMPAGAITYSNQASSIISGTEETTPVTNSIPPSLFRERTNFLAVEVHQRHNTLPLPSYSDDLLFDLELTITTNSGNFPPTVRWQSPAPFAAFSWPADISLAVTVQDESPSTGEAVFYANGVRLGSDTNSPYSLTWSNPPPGSYSLSCRFTDAGGLSAVTPAASISILPTSGTLLTLLPAGAVWSYDDSGTDLLTSWRLPSYKPYHWKSGPAQLGYGDGDEATEISYGRDYQNRNITTYFRAPFSNPALVSNLWLRLLRDDAAVLYLNGSEVFRNNLSPGHIASTNLALVELGPEEENDWIVASLPTNSLHTGANLLAVELHQANRRTLDASFDLELTALANPLPVVSLTSPAPNSRLFQPPSVPLTATASDPFGSVASVTFLVDDFPIGTVASPPYQLLWLEPAPGPHTLTARASDSLGATATSAAIAVTIQTPITLTITPLGSQFELSWAAGESGWQLQSTTNLTPPISWDAPTNQPSLSDGRYRLLLEREAIHRFFRLQLQP